MSENGPRIHERDTVMRQAERDWEGALLDLVRKYDLDFAEQMLVVSKVSSGWLQSMARSAIDEDRKQAQARARKRPVRKDA